MRLTFLSVLLAIICYGCGDSYEDTTLWKIEGNGLTTPSYLFGTIHIGCNISLRKKVLRALEETEKLILEIDPDELYSEEYFEEYAELPEGKILQDYMSPEDYTLVREYLLDFVDFDLNEYPTIHPMALRITNVPPELRCLEQDSYEGVLTDYAWENDMQTGGLETMEFQTGLISKAPVEEYVGYLLKAAKSGKPSSSDPLRMIVIHYKNQNLDGLSRVIFSDKYFKSYRMNETLLDERNLNWIPKIDSIVNKQSTTIAVGVGHLIGEKGLIKLLEEKGYTLTPILK
ncbi:MAG: TraB/GumN family protein [Gilvibacter sp.]